jgi:hypothetical protein
MNKFARNVAITFGLISTVAVAGQINKFFDNSVNYPPLNTGYLWTRGLNTIDPPVGSTANVLASVMENVTNGAKGLFAWNIYTQTTTDQDGGDTVGLYSRMHINGTNNWNAAFHAEQFQHNSSSNGTSIGFNTEAYNEESFGDTPTNTVIGFDAHAKTGGLDTAFLVQQVDGGGQGGGQNNGWKTGLALNGTTI